MPVWINEVTRGMWKKSETYLPMQASHSGHPPPLLEGMYADSLFERHVDELVMDVVQHFAIYLQSLEDLLMRVLQCYLRECRSDLSPARKCTASMWCS